jgi:nucleotide-binding universal stress UspA family protein
MYKKILVPLDGSKLAECVLPHVEALVSGCGSPEVVLVSVTESIPINRSLRDPHTSAAWMMDTAVPQGPMTPDTTKEDARHPRIMGRMFTQADKYLDRIQRQLLKKNIQSRTEVLCDNDTAGAIAGYADKTGVDLIVMASHGKGGEAIRRWARGSVADRVFRCTCVPVLMVQAPTA